MNSIIETRETNFKFDGSLDWQFIYYDDVHELNDLEAEFRLREMEGYKTENGVLMIPDCNLYRLSLHLKYFKEEFLGMSSQTDDAKDYQESNHPLMQAFFRIRDRNKEIVEEMKKSMLEQFMNFLGRTTSTTELSKQYAILTMKKERDDEFLQMTRTFQRAFQEESYIMENRIDDDNLSTSTQNDNPNRTQEIKEEEDNKSTWLSTTGKSKRWADYSSDDSDDVQ